MEAEDKLKLSSLINHNHLENTIEENLQFTLTRNMIEFLGGYSERLE